LSVASDAPALVIAVPGHAQADSDEVGHRVAATAGLSCPGVDIRVGYLDGDELPLSECLLPDGPQAEDHDQFPSVVVPLLMSPSANFDARLRQLTASSPIPAVLAAHLGPHPLVAEALHARLADAGLARPARSTGLSISADSRGVVVLADVGEEAASAAGVAAVLLASRLSVPVVPASLGDPASIVDAVNRLSESGAARPVLAPCLIGPETNISVLEDLSAALGAPCAPTLGAHQAIGQLVAIRYGAALASLSLAG
jgi:sirohydrochlorin ferrochelatase